MVTVGRYTLVARNVSILGTDHEFVEPGVPIIFASRLEHGFQRLSRMTFGLVAVVRSCRVFGSSVERLMLPVQL